MEAEHDSRAAAAPPRPRVVLDGETLTVPDVVRVAREAAPCELSPDAIGRMESSRALVEEVVASDRVTYGVNTGFGDLSSVVIEHDQIRQLQRNLILSHSVGVGAPLEEEIVRAMMALRANSLAKGYSGVRVSTVRALLEMLNAGLLPVVPSRGSVGASGDLAPLAHVALALIGEGEVTVGGERRWAREALAGAGIEPVTLEAKEGLALINGTQAMTAVAALALHDADVLIRTSEAAAAMSTEALRGTDAHFNPRIQEARPHPDQAESAAHLRALLSGSEILLSHRDSTHKVQDAYSLRCVPQVMGAIRSAVSYCAGIVSVEMNSATDNPLCFADDGRVISGGNFHGQPVALALDVLALAMTQLGNFSERRVYRLTDAKESGLPPFLAPHPGVNSGMMVVQYLAAALASENKSLSWPASADTIPTSAGQEDFVSMGMGGALKLRRIVRNARLIVACELLCAAQGLEYLRPLRPSPKVEALRSLVRETSPPLDGDRPLHREIETLADRIERGELVM